LRLRKIPSTTTYLRRKNLDRLFTQLLNKCLLESVATLDVEEQLGLGSEGSDELDLNGIDVNTEFNDKCFDGGDIC